MIRSAAPALSRRPGGLRFLVAAALVLPLARLTPELPSVTSGTTELVRRSLAWLGVAAIRQDGVLRHGGGFAYEIVGPCLGLAPILLVAAGVLTSGGDGRSIVRGLVLGATSLWLLNLGRLIALFLVGIALPERFDLAHDAGQAIMAGAVAGFLLLWFRSTESTVGCD